MARSTTVAVAYDCLFPFTTGGGERQYRATADVLGDLGFDVDYLTSVQWDGPTPTQDRFRIVPIAPRLSLYDARGVRRIPAALRYAGSLFGALLRRRRRYAAVIVSGLPIFNVFAARLALLGSGTKLVVDYLEVWHRPQWVEYSGVVTGTIAWALQRLAIAITPLATCHSQLSATRLRREGLRRPPLVSPGLIDGAVEVAAPGPAANPPYVLYAGRHIPDKRVEVLPAAVAAAREQIPGLRLVILGTGPSSDAVRAEVRRVGGESWTDFPGFVSDAELDRLLHGAVALANPSRREGYGLVVVEANAHGTPVVLVADEGNAATELIDDGVNGVVSPTTRPTDLARAIRDVVDGGDDLRRTARAWYDTAVGTRTIRRTVEGILSGTAAADPHPGEDERRQPVTTPAPADVELTILMPCLNEAETLEVCIRKAQGFLQRSGIRGEVLVSDNGSTDGSQAIAERLGARVSHAPRRGYGAALINGIDTAHGRFVIMADADDSYDFENLEPFVERLRAGADLVMGNRFRGGIEPGAMPPLHKYLGNPVLSFIGELFFRPGIRDFHCGLRGFNRARIRELDLQTTGMEFASEMVVRASLARYRIEEVPTTLKKDGRSRPPHLRSWHDGWRHLRFLLLFAPRWLFVYPGLVAFFLGALTVGVLAFGGVNIGGVGFDVTTMVYASALCVIGFQSLLFFWLTKLYATQEGFLPTSERYRRIVARWSAERGLLIGVGLFVLGVVIGIVQVIVWGAIDFGTQNAAQAVRIAVPSALLIILGFQTVMMSFFSGVLTTPRREQRPEAVIES